MNFKLRPWDLSDLDSMVKYANNPKIAANMLDSFPYPYTVEDGKAFLSMVTSQDPPHNIFAIEVGGEAVGGINITVQDDVHRKNAAVGYWLGEPFWGQGIMTTAIRQMVDYSFANYDIKRIFAGPFGNNVGSQRALEKAGFQFEARFKGTVFKNNEYLDEVFYAIRRKP